jgi:hypothetical protein
MKRSLELMPSEPTGLLEAVLVVGPFSYSDIARSHFPPKMALGRAAPHRHQ